jgi:hypothetical protein
MLGFLPTQIAKFNDEGHSLDLTRYLTSEPDTRKCLPKFLEKLSLTTAHLANLDF